MKTDPLTKDRELGESYLRGDRDQELFEQSTAPTTIAPQGSVQIQAGEVKDFPTYEQDKS